MVLKTKTFQVGMDSNCYLVYDETFLDAVIIDPGFFEKEFSKIIEYVQNQGLSITRIINTHGHPDHTSGNKLVKEATGAPICIHKDDEVFLIHTNWPKKLRELHPEIPCPKCGKTSKHTFTIQTGTTTVLMGCMHCDFVIPFDASDNVDQYLKEEDSIDIGSHTFSVLHTPGHSPGGICLYCREENLLFSGDTLFNNGKGRVDNPFSHPEDMQKSLLKLWGLPEDTRVLSGHGPETTIRAEKPKTE